MITIRINASALKTTACMRRYWYMTQLGWVWKKEDEILTIGTAVHDYAAAVLKGTDEFAAIQVLSKYSESVRKVARTACASNNLARLPKCIQFTKTPETHTTLVQTIEHPFSILIERGEFNGEPYELYFEGTMDVIAKEKEWTRVIDHKSTRKHDKGEAFAMYQNDPQLLFYNWILCNYGEQVIGYNPGLMVTSAVNLIQIMNRSTDVTWTLGSHWWYTVAQMAEFERALKAIVMRIKHTIGEWLLHKQEPLREGLVNTACKYCDYAIHCLANDKESAKMVEGLFEVREYKPLDEK